MASIDQIKELVNLHDLAEWLQMERPGSKGNYKAPWRKDAKPSLSIFNDAKAWKDHTDDVGGSCIDLVMQVRHVDVGEALRLLHDFTGLEMDKPEQSAAPKKKALHEWIAERCLGMSDEPSYDKIAKKAAEYLKGRGISIDAIDLALSAKTLGFNTYANDKLEAGEYGYGGDAVAFVVRSHLLPSRNIAAVEMRYPIFVNGR